MDVPDASGCQVGKRPVRKHTSTRWLQCPRVCPLLLDTFVWDTRTNLCVSQASAEHHSSNVAGHRRCISRSLSRKWVSWAHGSGTRPQCSEMGSACLRIRARGMSLSGTVPKNAGLLLGCERGMRIWGNSTTVTMLYHRTRETSCLRNPRYTIRRRKITSQLRTSSYFSQPK
jgi:hypothetical protein